jgi:hypothetical protein
VRNASLVRRSPFSPTAKRDMQVSSIHYTSPSKPCKLHPKIPAIQEAAAPPKASRIAAQKINKTDQMHT